MPKKHRPRAGSHAFWPRKRARRNFGTIRAWSTEQVDEPHIQGFAGYKVGMTHAHIVDYRPTSTTSGQEVLMPVTVVEAPPLRVAAVRGYKKTPYGLKTVTEAWADKLDKNLVGRLNIPKKAQDVWDRLTDETVDDVRVLLHTQPAKVTGVDHRVPELMEYRVAGGDLKARLEFAKSLLGKEVDVTDAVKSGDMLDVIGVTKGFGFESRVVRFGTKLLVSKNSKHRRMIGTQGAWHPSYIRKDIPSDGQRGFHNRTEYNKRVLKVGETGGEITPRGGFPHYGEVRNKYILFHGSLPGPSKRLLRFRTAVRYHAGVEIQEPQISYISTESKQGA
jgi:large subunit ribosomal protein L3